MNYKALNKPEYEGIKTVRIADNNNNLPFFIEKRKERFKETLAAQNIELKNKELTKAALWAKLSLDALVTNQRGKGIWAGLPWFNNYWGNYFYFFPIFR